LVGGDHAEREALLAELFDPAAGTFTDAVGVEEKGYHHRGLEGRSSHAVLPVILVESGKVELLHHIEEEQGQGVFLHPVQDGRGEQVELIAVAGKKMLGHGSLLGTDLGLASFYHRWEGCAWLGSWAQEIIWELCDRLTGYFLRGTHSSDQPT
jgi:hypothetical protein